MAAPDAAPEPAPEPPTSAARPRSGRSSATETLGERVRQLRLALGASQETIAELAGVHWTLIGQVERGQRNLTLHNLIRLAAALDTDPGVLVAGITPDDLPEERKRESKADAIRRERESR
ncbi:helix-turn-helix transcriptional regulator [Salinibacterium sp. dk2585]|uniref:helix-turn-helix domain-containing protein n=1 Tax=unclassified Salinibacterium TaxID=2632331 RepID=UPI0011C25494|nr:MULTISPECIES: helix-turn-helix transcriptional regulator [unclassified Salinibacterium]QEE60476.1 helix-turn-helix transcriptional regulator [Salinibacterium sp. dk2585]TXK55548.1 helix-turn-helix transcriptional regulator [Salinibacterium sp. dk5596]